MKKQLYVFSIVTLLIVGNILAQTDMDAHNKKYDYRGEIKMPTIATNINKLLGVPRKNWSTFGPSYDDCPKLNQWLNETQEYFASQNAIKRKVFLTNNKGEKYTVEESEIVTTFYSCLSEIRFIKSQVAENNKYKKILKENDIPRIMKRHPGFNAPRLSLNAMISKNINEGVYPDKKDIYFIDVYENTYVILQMINDNSALFNDTDGQWPSIYFLAPDGRPLKEGVALNYAADYYTFEGLKTYKNMQGFERQAFIIRGHLDPEFRLNFISFIYTQQWLRDKNIDGM